MIDARNCCRSSGRFGSFSRSSYGLQTSAQCQHAMIGRRIAAAIPHPVMWDEQHE